MLVQHSTQYKKDVPSWGLSDSFWERIKPFIPKPKSRLRGRGQYRKHSGGRPSAEPRQVMAGILYVLRTGCQWNAVPREYGLGKTLHRYFQRWTRVGVFKKRWKSGLGGYAEVRGIGWKWQAADGEITKAPLIRPATGANPTDRGKRGTKRSRLVESKGVPLNSCRKLRMSGGKLSISWMPRRYALSLTTMRNFGEESDLFAAYLESQLSKNRELQS